MGQGQREIKPPSFKPLNCRKKKTFLEMLCFRFFCPLKLKLFEIKYCTSTQQFIISVRNEFK